MVTDAPVGPVLFLRGAEAGRLQLSAILAVASGRAVPEALRTAEGAAPPEVLLHRTTHRVVRYRFDLPFDVRARYELGGRRYEVNTAWEGDLRLAYVACNGQEHGDLERPVEERNAMWLRLARQQEEAPLNLLLHGGDQVYADEVIRAHPLSADWPENVPATVAPAELTQLEEALRDAFFQRYLVQYGQTGFAEMAARVPSLAMWDDHDICDGWGSLPGELLDSDVGRALFRIAREAFLVFQCGAAPDEVPPLCADRTGQSLTWAVHLPGVDLIAPDLRSERRPDRVMGSRGWAAFRKGLADASGARILILSSVPALGPRLSLVERAMRLTPWAERYEDDLRDQWQSQAHRDEWRRFLAALLERHEGDQRRVTLLSGEIHLATRATMSAAPEPVHQLVSSGITHPPPPRAYAAALGVLARFGEAPIAAHPIRLHSLPGQRGRYTAERNFLVLTRSGGTWRASWELEESGATPPLAL